MRFVNPHRWKYCRDCYKLLRYNDEFTNEIMSAVCCNESEYEDLNCTGDGKIDSYRL